MPTASRAKSHPPTWDDVREEASALTREVMEQSLLWTRRAIHMASHVAEMTTQATEKTTERAKRRFERIRRR